MPATNEAVTLAVAAAKAADDKKGEDLAILDVADLLGIVELFLLVSAGNDRQVKAIAENIEDCLRDDIGRRPLRREGTPASGWFLLDYGDIVCHVFDTEQRSFYDLDRLWGDVASLDPTTGEILRPAMGTLG